MHRVNVCHGNLKLDNVLLEIVDGEYVPRLIDFEWSNPNMIASDTGTCLSNGSKSADIQQFFLLWSQCASIFLHAVEDGTYNRSSLLKFFRTEFQNIPETSVIGVLWRMPWFVEPVEVPQLVAGTCESNRVTDLIFKYQTRGILNFEDRLLDGFFDAGPYVVCPRLDQARKILDAHQESGIIVVHPQTDTGLIDLLARVRLVLASKLELNNDPWQRCHFLVHYFSAQMKQSDVAEQKEIYAEVRHRSIDGLVPLGAFWWNRVADAHAMVLLFKYLIDELEKVSPQQQRLKCRVIRGKEIEVVKYRGESTFPRQALERQVLYMNDVRIPSSPSRPFEETITIDWNLNKIRDQLVQLVTPESREVCQQPLRHHVHKNVCKPSVHTRNSLDHCLCIRSFSSRTKPWTRCVYRSVS